jgi:hypothetical protein
VHDANGAHTDHMSQADLGSWMLPFAAFVAELSRELADLTGTGGSDGVAHRREVAGSAGGNSAAGTDQACRASPFNTS